jgi:hypothetical protein
LELKNSRKDLNKGKEQLTVFPTPRS